MRWLKMLVGACLIAASYSTIAEQSIHQPGVELTGFQETPPVLSNGAGSFKWKFNKKDLLINYTLNYSELSSTTTVAHVHFGHPGATGAPIVFLCGGNGKPACPPNGGTVTGTLLASDVLSVPAQGINGGSFSDLLAVLFSGKAYVNVHTTKHPAGEIRGQIKKKFSD